MTKAEFLRKVESITEVEAGTLDGSEVLRDLDGWDSLAVMSALAMLDKHFGIKVSAERIYHCKTVAALADLTGGRVTD